MPQEFLVVMDVANPSRAFSIKGVQPPALAKGDVVTFCNLEEADFDHLPPKDRNFFEGCRVFLAENTEENRQRIAAELEAERKHWESITDKHPTGCSALKGFRGYGVKA